MKQKMQLTQAMPNQSSGGLNQYISKASKGSSNRKSLIKIQQQAESPNPKLPSNRPQNALADLYGTSNGGAFSGLGSLGAEGIQINKDSGRDSKPDSTDQANWYEIRSKSKAPERRAYHSCFIWQHKLYIYGGEDSHEGFRNSMHYLDLECLGKTTDKVGSTTQMPKWDSIVVDPRYKQSPQQIAHHTTVVYNNVAFLVGGTHPNYESNERLFKFEFITNKWVIAQQGGQLPGPRDDHSCVVWKDKMLVFGGYAHGVKNNSLYMFNFTNNEWVCLFDENSYVENGQAPSPRSGHSAVVVDDKMVIFGGIDANLRRLNDTWIFDMNSGQWSCPAIKITDFYKPRERSGHTAVLFRETYMVVFGGMTAVTKELDDVVALNLLTFEWHMVTEPKQTKPPEKPKNALLSKFGKLMNRQLGTALTGVKADKSPMPNLKHQDSQDPYGTGMGLLKRKTTFKDQVANATQSSGGLALINRRTSLLPDPIGPFGRRSASVDQQNPLSIMDPNNTSFSSSFLQRRKSQQAERRKSSLNGKGFGSEGETAVDLMSPTSDRMRNSFIITNGATKNMELFRKAQAAKKSIILQHAQDDDKANPNKKESPEDRQRRMDEMRCRQLMLNGDKVINFMVCQGKRPSAREGHTAIKYISEGTDNVWLMIFGGDRHGMPFNDLHILDLNSEFMKAGIF